MNPEIKAQWVAALRSEEFPQGKGALQAEGKFCCLGVLCHLAAVAGIVTAVLYDGIIRYGDAAEHREHHADSGTLPDSVRRWAKIESGNPILIPGNAFGAAAVLNDGGMPFAQIADLIERSL